MRRGTVTVYPTTGDPVQITTADDDVIREFETLPFTAETVMRVHVQYETDDGTAA